MNILEKIVAHKKIEVAEAILQSPFAHLEKRDLFSRTTLSLKDRLLDPNHLGIIAEFKRQSPSKGIINATAIPQQVAQAYQKAGVAGMSVLTDKEFFGGNVQDFHAARELLEIPMLRKDFMISEYQIVEAKSIGADVVLLIAECLSKQAVYDLAKLARSLELDVLLEVHSEKQLSKINPFISIVGINNRNLETFEVSIDHSIELFDKIPADFARISESGISDPNNIVTLKKVGFDGFLIGENFMKTDDPGLSCQQFIANVNSRLQ